MKKCSKCGEVKELDTFYKDSSKPDGYCYSCKICKKKCEKRTQTRIKKQRKEGKLIQQNKKCSKCELIKTPDNFRKSNNTKDGLGSRCKDCESVRKKEYTIKNKEKITKQEREYRKNNPDKIKLSQEKYKENNMHKILERNKTWRKKNKGKINSYTAKRRANHLEATPSWSEKEKIEVLYKKAKWLGEITGKTYHVDHIIPLQGKMVSGLHVWQNLQILEDKLNLKKSNKLKINIDTEKET